MLPSRTLRDSLPFLVEEGQCEVWQSGYKLFDSMRYFNNFVGRYLGEFASRVDRDIDDHWSLLFSDDDHLWGRAIITSSEDGEPLYPPIEEDCGLHRLYLRLNLVAQLPMPSPKASYQDIIEFKRHRSSELRALHEELDYVCAGLSGVIDSEEAVRIGVDRVNRIVGDFDAIFSERWPVLLRSSIRRSLGSMTAAAAAGTTLFGGNGLASIAAGVAGALTPPIFQSTIDRFFGRASGIPKPYVYAYSAARDL